jgi:hypothetical protein
VRRQGLYDLLEAPRAQAGHVAIIRIEQLYPFPQASLRPGECAIPMLTDLVWCQEEPKTRAPGSNRFTIWIGLAAELNDPLRRPPPFGFAGSGLSQRPCRTATKAGQRGAGPVTTAAQIASIAQNRKGTKK